MSNEVDLIDKLATAYQPLAKVVSDLGGSLHKIETIVIRQETKFEDYMVQVTKMLENHEKSIKALEESDTDIRSTFKGGKWVAGLSAVLVLGLMGTISTLFYNIYIRDLLAINVKIDTIQAQTK